MKDLYNKAELEFEHEKKKSIQNNKKFIEKFTKSFIETNLQKRNMKKEVIPKTLTRSVYYFYHYFNKIVHISAANKLGYIPFICGKPNILGIRELDETEFQKPTINREYEIKKRMAKKVILKFSYEKFISFVESVRRKKEIPKSNEVRLIKSLCLYFECTIEEFIDRYEFLYDKNSFNLSGKFEDLQHHFCHICHMFGCVLHSIKNYESLKKKEQ